MKIFPYRDSQGNICGFDPSEVEGTGGASGGSVGDSTICRTCTAPQQMPITRRLQCATAPSCPTMGEFDHTPMHAHVRKALISTEEDVCRRLVTPLQRLVAGKQDAIQQQLRARIQDMEREEAKVIYPTPMSAFRNDNRILRKAYRSYKRDVQLEKERGTYTKKPKYFYDENTRKWYEDMIRVGKPCTDKDTQELLNRSDCVTFPDATGGSCFNCPQRMMSAAPPDHAPSSHKICDCSGPY